MSVRIKTILSVIVISYLGTFLQWNFSVFYVQRNWGLYFEGFSLFIIIVTVLVALASLFLFFFMRGFDQTEKMLREGGRLDERGNRSYDRGIRRVPVVLTVVNLIGFFLGPVSQHLVNQLTRGEALFSIALLTTVLYSLAFGIYVLFLEIRLFERYCLPLATLRRRTVLDGGATRSWLKRQYGLGFTIVILAFSLMFASGLGYLREELMAPATVDATAAATEIGDARTELWQQALEGNPPALSLNSPQVLPRFIEYLWKMGLLGLVITAMSYLALRIESGPVSGRLQQLVRNIENLAGGRAGKAEKLSILMDDELGLAMSHMNSFIDRQNREFATIRSSIQDAVSLSGDLESINIKAEELGKTIGDGIHRVQAELSQQQKALLAVEKEVSALTDNINQASGNLQQQHAAVDSSSSAIEEMIANIASVSRNSKEAYDHTQELSLKAESGTSEMQALLQGIQNIASASEKVSENIGQIAKIAAQTNLLAMNAAIEAAHAGDVGSGFAVVASEVRKLAENSSRTAKSVTGLIRSMNEYSSEGVQTAGRAMERFTWINRGVQENSRIISEITQAMVEQEQGNSDIQKSISLLLDLSREAADITTRQSRESLEVQARMQDLDGAARTIESVMDQNLEALQSVESFIANLQLLIERNSQIVRSLKEIAET